MHGLVRGYYKCSMPSCHAKKLVEKSGDDMETILCVKYESTHNHAIAEADREEAGLNDPDYGDNSEDDQDHSEDSSLANDY